MLSRNDLREYRFISGLSLRDVARYCNKSAQAIGQMENGEISLTDEMHQEVIIGINAAKQAIADGAFETDKDMEREAQKIRKKEAEQVEKPEAIKLATKKRTKNQDK